MNSPLVFVGISSGTPVAQSNGGKFTCSTPAAVVFSLQSVAGVSRWELDIYSDSQSLNGQTRIWRQGTIPQQDNAISFNIPEGASGLSYLSKTFDVFGSMSHVSGSIVGIFGSIVGSVRVGTTTTVYEDATDWVAVPAGSTVDVYDLPDGPISMNEIVSLAAYIPLQSFDDPTKFGHFERRITVSNVAGQVQTPAGGTSDDDVTVPSSPANMSSALTGALAAIVIASGTLSVSVTAPPGINIRAAVNASIARRTTSNANPVPIPTLTGVTSTQLGIWEGGDTRTGTGTNLMGASFTVGGVPATGIVIGGGGTTWSLVTPASGGAISGGWAIVVATVSGVSATLTETSGLFYLPSGTVAIFDAARGTTPPTPSNGIAMTAWADVSGVGGWSTSQGTPANDPVFVSSSAANGQPAIRTTNTGGAGSVSQNWGSGTIPSPSAITAWTHILVAVNGSADLSANTLIEFWQASGNAFTNGELVFDALSASSGPWSVIAGNNPSSEVSTPIPIGSACCISSRSDGAHNIVRMNGADGTSFASTASFTFTHFCIGGSGVSVLPIPIQLDTCLFIASSRAWGSADFTAFSTYTNFKFGVAAA